MNWFVNIARCKDDTLYTGITTNLKRREREHNTNNKLGAKSLRNKRPVCIVYCEEYITQNSARIGEVEIKKLIIKKKVLRKKLLISDFFCAPRRT